MTWRGRGIFWLVVGTIALLVIAEGTGFWIPGLDVFLELTFGWVAFLGRVSPLIRVRWDLVGSAVLYVAVLVVGSHYFLIWLYRELNRSTTSSGPTASRAWRWRWTLSGFVIVLLMFSAGMAAMGILHQTAWQLQSPEKLYVRKPLPADPIKCASNMKQIALALYLYATEHTGKFPDDLPTLSLHSDLSPSVFVCPASNDVYPNPAHPAEQNAADLTKPGHCSYLYFGKGLTQPVDPKRVVLIEALENHVGTGANVLRGDGTVEWLDRDDAERLLHELKVNNRSPQGATTQAE